MPLPTLNDGLREEWKLVFNDLQDLGLITTDTVVDWTPIARPFVLPFLTKAGEYREQCGEPLFKPHLWNGSKFVPSENWDITRQKLRYATGACRFGPCSLAEYVYQINTHGTSGEGNRFLAECLAGPRSLLRDRRSAMTDEDLVLAAIIDGVRAGGRDADQRWSDDSEDTIAHEQATENVIRKTINAALGVAGITPVWLNGKDDASQQHLDLLHPGVVVLIADAIDGYRMYQRHIPNWCIAVGAGRWNNGVLEPIIGVIFHPPTQELFVGIVESGAVLINERLAAFRPLPPKTTRAKAVIATHFSLEQPARSARLLTNLLCEAARSKDLIERVVMLGSGQLALAYVATQRCHVFANVTTHYWNAFAGIALIAASFGQDKTMVTDLAKQPWTIGSEGIIAWGGPEARTTLGGMLDRALQP